MAERHLFTKQGETALRHLMADQSEGREEPCGCAFVPLRSDEWNDDGHRSQEKGDQVKREQPVPGEPVDMPVDPDDQWLLFDPRQGLR